MHGLHRDGYAPTNYADLERNDAMPSVHPSVRPFIRSPWRRRGTPRKRRAHARAYPHTCVHPRAGLRNSEKSTRAGGDDIYLRIRRERDPGVSTRRNARTVSREGNVSYIERDSNSFANSCLTRLPRQCARIDLRMLGRSNNCERIFNNSQFSNFVKKFTK